MIVTCEACSARYKLDDAKVSAKGAKITCPRCRHVFVVYRKTRGEDEGHAVQVAEKRARSAEELDFRRVGIASWKVRVKIGLVYDFSDLKTLRKYIADGRVTPDDAISFDGRSWTTIGDIPDLDAYFVQVYAAAEARLDGPSGDGFDEDAPTTIAHDSQLANNLARMALQQVESETGASAPRPASPAGAPTGSQFVDPFAALKDKQRERIAQKRTRTSEAAARQAGKRSNSGPIALALLVVLAVGAYLYASSRPAPTAEVRRGAPPTRDVAEGPERDPSAFREELKSTLVAELDVEVGDTGSDEPRPEEMKPVVPEEFRNGTAAAAPPRPAGLVSPRAVAGTTSGGSAPGAVQVSSTTAADHLAVGDDMYRKGDWSGAATAYQQALAMQPAASVKIKLGAALYKAARYDQAQSHLSGATSEPEAYKWLARVAAALGDVSGANGYYQQYLATNPRDADTIEAEMQSLM